MYSCSAIHVRKLILSPFYRGNIFTLEKSNFFFVECSIKIKNSPKSIEGELQKSDVFMLFLIFNDIWWKRFFFGLIWHEEVDLNKTNIFCDRTNSWKWTPKVLEVFQGFSSKNRWSDPIYPTPFCCSDPNYPI